VRKNFAPANHFLYFMNTHRRQPTQIFSSGTVLEEWYSPMAKILNKSRFSDAAFKALPMAPFILSGCLRQILDTSSLREYVQTLFHLDTNQIVAPIARATWSDALASPMRRDILRPAVMQLVEFAQAILPDRLSHLKGIGSRPVIATDATYQKESAHYEPHYPSTGGGNDNKKGHMLLSHFDVRHGIALNVTTETRSLAEIRVLKSEESKGVNWMRAKRAIHVVDRAFIDGVFWDQRYKLYGSTVITRMKSTLIYTVIKENEVEVNISNDGILYDRTVKLQSSSGTWRLIGFHSPEGIDYEYLTNDQELLPGVVAFIYYRRWDKEKYYDSFKNDLAGSKAWGKSPVAIEQQALLGIVTTILTRLFLMRRQAELELSKPDATQEKKHQKKLASYTESGEGVLLRAVWQNLSKITRQVWRFLKNCFACQHAPELYKRQLEPMLLRYL
jgi:hypothetical protein